MKLTSKIAAIFAVIAFTTSAHAAKINGAITFSGNAILDNSALNLATKVVGWATPTVGSTSGNFTSVANGTAVTFASPWTFTSPANPFWSVGGFTFNLTSSAIRTQDSEFLDIRGTGIVSGNGFEPTNGTWRFSSQAPGAGAGGTSFSFSGSTATVPDGGATLALLGVSFLGLGGVSRLVRRK